MVVVCTVIHGRYSEKAVTDARVVQSLVVTVRRQSLMRESYQSLVQRCL